MSASINLQTAMEFLSALEPDQASVLTFQTFSDDKARFNVPALKLHTAGADMRDTLTDLEGWNEKGAGVFITVNETDGLGREKENVRRVRAFFIDLDDKPLPEAWHLQPHIIVERDATHHHAYWLVHDVPLDAFETVQQRLIAHYKSDEAVCDLSRVMRVPGFLHRKVEPVEVAWSRVYDGPRYSLEQIVADISPSPGEMSRISSEETKQVRQAVQAESSYWQTWPSDDYCARATADDTAVILESHGWKPEKDWKSTEGRGNFRHFTRPGKDAGVSASVNPRGWFRSFSSNTPPFVARKWYSPYAILLELECAGDKKRAHALLKSKGYGQVRPQTQPVKTPDAPPIVVGMPKALELPGYVDQVRRGEVKMVDFGPWSLLSKSSRALVPQTISVLVGLRGKGKSFLILQAAMYWDKQGVPFAVLELEQTQRFYEQRLLAMLAGNGDYAQEEYWAQHPEEVDEAMATHSKDVLRLIQSIDTQLENDTTDGVLAWLRAQAVAGKRVLVVDPISAREGVREPWLDDKYFMKRAREIVNEFMCSIVFVTHLKTTRGKDIKAVYLSDGYETEGGKKIEDSCDTLLMLLSVEEEEARCLNAMGEEMARVNQHIWLKKTRLAKRAASKIIGLYHDPVSALHVERGFILKDDAPSPAPPRDEPKSERREWTPEEFVSTFLSSEGKTKTQIVVAANDAGLRDGTVDNLLRKAVAKKLVIVDRPKGRGEARYSVRKDTLL